MAYCRVRTTMRLCRRRRVTDLAVVGSSSAPIRVFAVAFVAFVPRHAATSSTATKILCAMVGFVCMLSHVASCRAARTHISNHVWGPVVCFSSVLLHHSNTYTHIYLPSLQNIYSNTSSFTARPTTLTSIEPTHKHTHLPTHLSN